MSFTKAQLQKVADLSAEVSALAGAVRIEQEQTRERSREWHARYADVGTPYKTWDSPHGHTPLTAELRRRSMDLTRALAELRKS